MYVYRVRYYGLEFGSILDFGICRGPLVGAPTLFKRIYTVFIVDHTWSKFLFFQVLLLGSRNLGSSSWVPIKKALLL